MKKLVLILSVLAVSLSGCYAVPHRGHDDGYRDDRNSRHERDRDRSDNREYDRSRDGYR